jgi:DtxR family Mn-dependent transcriptional regulator
MNNPLVLLVSAIILLVVLYLLFRPRTGLFPRLRTMRRLNERVLREDALKHIQKLEYFGKSPTLRSIAGALSIDSNQAAIVMDDLLTRQLVCVNDGVWCLTPEGREVATQVIRAHRLWERFLQEETGYGEEEWHDRAEEFEHRLTAEQIDQLARDLGHPTHDPHGDPIPNAEGYLPYLEGISLVKLPPNQPARIIHIPDEPEMVAAQIRAEGLVPGMLVHLIDSSPLRIRFLINGDEHVLAPLVASGIVVIPLEEAPEPIPAAEPLWKLKKGERGEVVMLSPRCRGPERRRLMDLGVLPGTIVEAEMVSPSGDPTAYRIRDALIALRREQAEWIRIKPLTAEAQL